MIPRKIKNISKDFALNILASFILTGILQLVVYPVLAKSLSGDDYGVLLTAIGLANTFAAATGNSLNNTRLLLNPEYEERGYVGDFLPILLISNAFAAAILFFAVRKYESDLLTRIILVAYMIANAARSYGSVAYRIKINYTKILVCNVLVGIGDLIGIAILTASKGNSHLWPICFLLGEILAIIYIFVSSGVFRERIAFTPYVGKTIRKESVLMSTTLAANLLIYLDRMLLLPLLGGEAVTTYTVASIFGKSIGIVMTPIAGVLLSYFSQKDFAMNRKSFHIFYLANILIALVFMLGSHLAAPWFTGLLYPTEIAASRPYLDIANAAAIIAVTASMTQPTVLKYAPSYWLLIIQISYSVAYLLGGYLCVRGYGLMGFSYAALLSACMKVLFQYIAGNRYIGSRVDRSVEDYEERQ